MKADDGVAALGDVCEGGSLAGKLSANASSSEPGVCAGSVLAMSTLRHAARQRASAGVAPS
jgi:hypothetical protein